MKLHIARQVEATPTHTIAAPTHLKQYIHTLRLDTVSQSDEFFKPFRLAPAKDPEGFPSVGIYDFRTSKGLVNEYFDALCFVVALYRDRLSLSLQLGSRTCKVGGKFVCSGSCILWNKAKILKECVKSALPRTSLLAILTHRKTGRASARRATLWSYQELFRSYCKKRFLCFHLFRRLVVAELSAARFTLVRSGHLSSYAE